MKESIEKSKAIIFIHGSGENSSAWKNQLKLNIIYNLVAIDLPSHANSEKIGELSLDLYVDVLKKLIEALKLKEVILCGHSLGGAIVQTYYFKYPKDMVGLILCSTGGRLRVNPFILESLKTNYKTYLDSIPAGAFYRKTSKNIIENYLKETALTNAEVAYADFSICDKFDTLDKTSSIIVPCLIVCGDMDKLTPLKYSQYFKDKIKNSILSVIRDAGHMVMLEKPEEVNLAIKEFIEKKIEKKQK